MPRLKRVSASTASRSAARASSSRATSSRSPERSSSSKRRSRIRSRCADSNSRERRHCPPWATACRRWCHSGKTSPSTWAKCPRSTALPGRAPGASRSMPGTTSAQRWACCLLGLLVFFMLLETVTVDLKPADARVSAVEGFSWQTASSVFVFPVNTRCARTAKVTRPPKRACRSTAANRQPRCCT